MTTKYVDKKMIHASNHIRVTQYFYLTGVRIYLEFPDAEQNFSVWVKYPTMQDTIAIMNRQIKTPS